LLYLLIFRYFIVTFLGNAGVLPAKREVSDSMEEKIPFRKCTFIENAQGAQLIGNKCKSCGQIFFPKVSLCLNCFHHDLEEIFLSSQGELYSFTTAYMPASGFEPPYTVGYVILPEGIRVFAPLKEIEGKHFQIGMTMKLIIEKLWKKDEKDVIGYKFTPA
jgi:uncharacterized OB-fold protein